MPITKTKRRCRVLHLRSVYRVLDKVLRTYAIWLNLMVNSDFL